MKKRQIFYEILNAAAEIFELRSVEILSGSHRQEIVEARAISLHYLMAAGLSAKDIIRFSEGSIRNAYSVTKSASTFYDRIARSFVLRCQNCRLSRAVEEIKQRASTKEKQAENEQ